MNRKIVIRSIRWGNRYVPAEWWLEGVGGPVMIGRDLIADANPEYFRKHKDTITFGPYTLKIVAENGDYVTCEVASGAKFDMGDFVCDSGFMPGHSWRATVVGLKYVAFSIFPGWEYDLLYTNGTLHIMGEAHIQLDPKGDL
jgi:hypothetical protein